MMTKLKIYNNPINIKLPEQFVWINLGKVLSVSEVIDFGSLDYPKIEGAYYLAIGNDLAYRVYLSDEHKTELGMG